MAALTTDLVTKKSKLMPLLTALCCLIAAAIAGYATHRGVILPNWSADEILSRRADHDGTAQLDYLQISPVTISLGSTSGPRQLRFSAQLEVPKQHHQEVAQLLPRISDMLNSYLYALDVTELQAPGALPQLKAQLLRRLKIVAGKDRISDLLISEFIIN